MSFFNRDHRIDKDGREIDHNLSNIPSWLVGESQSLISTKCANEFWQVEALQGSDGYIEIVYREKNSQRILTPGMDQSMQSVALEPIVSRTFNPDEWRIAQAVFKRYYQLETLYRDGNKPAQRAQARAVFRDVLRTSRMTRPTSARLLRDGQLILKDPRRTSLYQKDQFINVDEVDKLTQLVKALCDRQAYGESINPIQLADKIADVLSQLVKLNRYSRVDAAKVEPAIKETPTFQMNLTNVVKAIMTVRQRQSGVVLMMGEAGVGKGTIAQYIAAKTGRPYFKVDCGRGLDARDLLFSTELHGGTTYTVLNTLIRGIQTPNAVVLIDEVNALKPEVQAILHGLGDSSRSVSLDNHTFKMAEGVIILMAANPATYASAGNIGEALLDRTTGVEIIYPSLTEGEYQQHIHGWTEAELREKMVHDSTLNRVRCDEVLVLYELIPEFAKLSQEDFTNYWNAIVQERPELGYISDKVTSQETRKTFQDLKILLEIANQWRKFYAKREKFDDISVSQRQLMNVVAEYARNGRNMREAVLTVFGYYKTNPREALNRTYQALIPIVDMFLPHIQQLYKTP